MKKAELINKISIAAGITKKQAADAVAEFQLAVSQALCAGESVVLPSFGTFKSNHRNSREGRNPQTGESITIPAKRVAQFKASSALTDSLNK